LQYSGEELGELSKLKISHKVDSTLLNLMNNDFEDLKDYWSEYQQTNQNGRSGPE
jgi:hypothetical protein